MLGMQEAQFNPGIARSPEYHQEQPPSMKLEQALSTTDDGPKTKNTRGWRGGTGITVHVLQVAKSSSVPSTIWSWSH